MNTSRMWSAVVVLMLLGFMIVSAQSAIGQNFILRVDIANGSPTGNGSDWGQDAYQFLQDALAEAAVLTQDPEVTVHLWVAAGWDDVNEEWIPYLPPQQFNSEYDPNTCDPGFDCCDPFSLCEGREASFELINNVHIYGGFPPDPHTWNNDDGAAFIDRNPYSFITILDGDLAQNDDVQIYDQNRELILDFQNYTDNCHHVVTAENIDESARLDGFTIRGGSPLSGSDTSGSRRGAGIWMSHSSPTIANCIIEQNEIWHPALQPVATQQGGAGVSIFAFSSPQFINCTIRHNRAKGGGGGIAAVSFFDPLNPDTAVDTFPVLINSTIWENMATNGGGCASWGAPYTFVNSSIVDNVAASVGGLRNEFDWLQGGRGISFTADHDIDNSELRLWNSVIAGNRDVGVVGGGGMVVAGAPTFLVNCTVAYNESNHVGGGILEGPPPPFSPELGCSEYPMFINIDNSILWGNTAVNDGDHVYSTTRLYVDYSDVEGATDGLEIAGGGCMVYTANNISVDPEFRNVAMHDYRINSDSPCIDAGNRTLLPCDEYDLNQNGVTCGSGGSGEEIPYDRRFLDRVAEVTIEEVDIGAYEFQSCGPADLDSDDVVGIFDLLILLGAWGPCQACPEDLNGDDEVGVFDMLILLGSWGDCDGEDSGAVPSNVTECLEQYAPGTVELERCLQMTTE